MGGGMPGMPPTQTSTAGMDLSAAAQAAREALEKAKRAAMFQRQIQEQMAKLKNQGLAAGFLPGEGPKARMKKILGVKGDGEGGEQYFDNSLKTSMRFERPKRKGFRFIEAGDLVRKEKRLL